MALPRRAVLALLAVTDIALHARGDLVSARDLSERHKLAPRVFETVLQDLTRAGLIKGQRGPKGGYRLARERRKITAADVVRAVGLADPREALPGTLLATEVVAPALAAGEAALFAALDGLTLERLIENAPAMAVIQDYTI
jgi:Rrf2 family protein